MRDPAKVLRLFALRRREAMCAIQVLSVAVGWWLLVFFLTRDSQFPSYYHNDEPSKIIQLQTGTRNLRHPPLMLSLADVALAISGVHRDTESIVRAGRLLSACYLAGAIVCMGLLAWREAGAAPGICVAALLVFNADLFECAHYFKEDALFLFGIACFCLCADVLALKKSTLLTVLFALATALVASSKYAGLALVPFALGTVVCLAVDQGFPRRNVWLFFGVFTVSLLSFYWPALWDCEMLKGEVGLEVSRLFEGHYGESSAPSTAPYKKHLLEQFSPFAWRLTWLYAFAKLIRRSPSGWVIIFFGSGYWMAISQAAKFSERYLLPIYLFFCFSVVVGASLVLRLLAKQLDLRQKNLLEACFVALAPLFLCLYILPSELDRFHARCEAFQEDSRVELQHWVVRHLPEDALIAQDHMVQLHTYPIGKRSIIDSYFVADLGTLEELRTRGVGFVAVSFDVYHRYVGPDHAGSAASSEEFQRRRAFYTQLFSKGKLLWKKGGRNPKPLHPGLALVQI